MNLDFDLNFVPWTNHTPKIFNQGFLKNTVFSYFTTNEANEALPDVIKKFEYALAKQNEVKKLEQVIRLKGWRMNFTRRVFMLYP